MSYPYNYRRTSAEVADGKVGRFQFAVLLLLSVTLAVGCTPSKIPPEQEIELDVELLREAIADINRQAADEDLKGAQPVQSKPVGQIDTLVPGPVPPPEGASSHIGLEDDTTDTVEGGEIRLRRIQPKMGTDEDPTPRNPNVTFDLGFSSRSQTPRPGVDERLLAAGERIRDRDYTYAFVILDEYLTAEIAVALDSAGVQLLGQHADAHKVKVPLNPTVIRGVASLPFVVWFGYPAPEQKLDTFLSEASKRLRKQLDVLPVTINFFEAEAAERFASVLRDQDIVLGRYDADLDAYPANVPFERLDWLLARDYVLFLELERGTSSGHDMSMSTMGVDYIRIGGGGTRFTGSSTILGIMDTGFMVGSAAPTMHVDLNKNGCGINFTSDAAGVWNDQHDHGTHVLGTVIGTGTGNSRNRGVATGVGNSGSTRIRAAKIWRSTGTGLNSWMRNAMDYMDDASSCSSGRPKVVNISGGSSGNGQVGTDAQSRKLDAKVWKHRQAYIVCGGNNGPGAETIWSPGVAKNALAVGNVLDNGFQTVGDVNNGSSRGPAGDDRMKPNVVGAGTVVTSSNAGTTNGYRNMTGCSMATPHVSGIAATLLQHYPAFRDRPHLLRAHLMATAILHDDTTLPANNNSGGRNNYGLGRVSSYVAHWAHANSNGWRTYWASRTITNSSWGFRDISVPTGADRLVVVLTWDEPAASSGASDAVTHDVDLWIDRGADCTPDSKGQCGEWASQSWDDNVEYLIINRPPSGNYRLKMINWSAPSSGIPVAIVATVIRGDPTPDMVLTASASQTNPTVGSTVTITTSVRNPSYIASGVFLERTNTPSGLTPGGVSIGREDGVSMNFTGSNLTLGNIVEGDTRTATWTFTVNNSQPKTVRFRAWSENGGTRTRSVTLNP